MRPLFRFDDARAHHPAVAQWFGKQKEPLAGMALRWFQCMRQCGDDVTETLHDGQPTACVEGAAFAYVDTFTSHVNVGFFQGATLPDPGHLLLGTGKYMRHVRLRP